MKDKIKERLNKATVAPWKIAAIGVCECPLCDGEGYVDGAEIDGDGWVALAQTYGIGDMVANNANFIANAPTDIQYLLAKSDNDDTTIKRLEQKIFGMRCCGNCGFGYYDEFEHLVCEKKLYADCYDDGYKNWEGQQRGGADDESHNHI